MGCYAVHLGDCIGGISKEHYISRSLLELAGKTVQVSGFPWQEPHEPMEIGIGALTSRILCSHHNSELSPLDETGRIFLPAVKSSFDEAVGNEIFAHEVFSIDGIKLELWLLKILCGIFAASSTVEVPGRWIEILFEREPFPEDSGMHIFGEPGSSGWFFNLVRVISVQDKKGDIAGAKFGVGGLALLLAFGQPLFSEEGIQSLYRPQSIVIEKDAHTKRLDFSWPGSKGAGSLHLKIANPINEGDSKIRPIVMPNRKQNNNG